jgi:hypothetical protein
MENTKIVKKNPTQNIAWDFFGVLEAPSGVEPDYRALQAPA